MVEVVQTSQQLIDQFADRLKPTDRSKLQDLGTELKKRYDTVYVESQTRQNRLTSAIPDLNKTLEDGQEISQWLVGVERQLQATQKNVGRDLDTLRRQLEEQTTFNEEVLSEGADVRFLNMNAKKKMDAAKVGKGYLSLYFHWTFISSVE